MKIQFEFSGYYNDVVENERITINFDRETLTLGEAVNELFYSFSHIKDEFERKGFLVEGVLQAIFVIDNNIMQSETLISNDVLIRVLPPICGG